MNFSRMYGSRGVPHDFADRATREAATDWASSACRAQVHAGHSTKRPLFAVSSDRGRERPRPCRARPADLVRSALRLAAPARCIAPGYASHPRWRAEECLGRGYSRGPTPTLRKVKPLLAESFRLEGLPNANWGLPMDASTPTLNNEWAPPPRGGGSPFRNVSLSQNVCNFSRFVFWQFHDRITQVLGRALGMSVPDHPVAPATRLTRKRGRYWFVGHFVLPLRTFSRVRMAPSVRFSFRAIEGLSIFEFISAKSCSSSAGNQGLPLG